MGEMRRKIGDNDDEMKRRARDNSTHSIEQILLAEHRERGRRWADVRGASNRSGNREDDCLWGDGE